MKHLNTYKIFEAWWSKKEPKKETFSLESDEGKKVWDVEKFNNIKTHMYDGMNESSTEFSDHNAGMNNIINTQGSNQITLPTDYYDFDMEEDEDELPNRTGRDDKSIPHQNKYKKTPYKMSAENLNVQDVMTYPTFILKDNPSILNSFYNQIK